MISLLQIYCWVWWWKNFEDRLGFGKVMAKNKVAPFFRTRCISPLLQHSLMRHCQNVYLRYYSIPRRHTVRMYISAITAFTHSYTWLWPLKTFSAMSNHLKNICGKFQWILSISDRMVRPQTGTGSGMSVIWTWMNQTKYATAAWSIYLHLCHVDEICGTHYAA